MAERICGTPAAASGDDYNDSLIGLTYLSNILSAWWGYVVNRFPIYIIVKGVRHMAGRGNVMPHHVISDESSRHQLPIIGKCCCAHQGGDHGMPRLQSLAPMMLLSKICR